MVLNSVNSPPHQVIKQDEVDEELIGGNWSTEPMSLARLLTHRQKVGKNFDCISCNNEEAISRRVVATIFEQKVAPSVLVWDENHWVVVYACDVSKAPKKTNGVFDPFDQSYDIEAFYIHDPSPGPPFGSNFDQTDLEHHDGDACGTGGAWGRSHIWIDYQHWKKMWLTGVDTRLEPNWLGDFITVVDAEADSLCPDWSIRQTPGRGPGSPRPRKQLEKAKIDAVAELSAKGLTGPNAPFPWNRLPEIPTATSAELVEPSRTGIPGFYYYLVEIEVPDKGKPVAVMLDPEIDPEIDPDRARFKMLAAAAASVPQPADVQGRGFRIVDETPTQEPATNNLSQARKGDTARSTGGRSYATDHNDSFQNMDVALTQEPTMDALGKISLEEIASKMTGRKYIIRGKEVTIDEDPHDKVRLVWEHRPPFSMSPFAPCYEIPVGDEAIYIRIDDPSLLESLSSTSAEEVINLNRYAGAYGQAGTW
jgi:hypothetical protein